MKKILIILLLFASCKTVEPVKLKTTTKEVKIERVYFKVSYILETFDGMKMAGKMQIERKERNDKQLMDILHKEIKNTVKNKENIKIISFNRL